MAIREVKTNDLPSDVVDAITSGKESKPRGKTAKAPKMQKVGAPPMKIGDYEGWRRLPPPPVPAHMKPPKPKALKNNMDLVRMLHTPSKDGKG